jgi:cell division protease FtsH
MGESLGPQTLRDGDESRSLPGLHLPAERQHSEHTAELVDAEVGDMLRRTYRRAVALVEHNQVALRRLATTLLDREVVEGAELDELLAGASAPPRLEEPDERAWERAM